MDRVFEESKYAMDAVARKFQIQTYETLAGLQELLSTAGHEDWREDWRNWRFSEDCECQRCIRFKMPLGSPRKAAGAFK